MIVGKLIKYLFNSDYRFVVDAYRGKYQDLDDETYIKRLFKGSLGYELNLKSPQTFNEKIQWLKLYDRKPEYTKMVDKYYAKEYVSDLIGSEHIVTTYGVWKNFEDIDFNSLPSQFVLKCTHDSGGVVVCREKKDLNIEKTRKILEKSLKRNFYTVSREWPYKNVEPQIMAEAYLEEEQNADGLIDYKFFCFNEKAEFLYISIGLDNHSTARMSFYDLDGKELEFGRSDYQKLGAIDLPDNYDEMLRIANIMAKEINSAFVRIDLYSVNGKIYFSEITFSPCGGLLPFSPINADKKVGKLLSLPTGVIANEEANKSTIVDSENE